jgi:DNA-binding XRE family transcriptional regulator
MHMLSPVQCKMARAALGWNVKDLARHAHIHHGTVVRFENELHEPNESTVVGIKRAFEAAGIEFTDNGGIVPPEKG